MADGGYFKGTSADQDNRFADKKRKLMKSMKFGEGLDKKVDMSKVNIDIIKPWITRRVTEMLGIEDDVVVGYIFNQLEDRYPDAKEMQINLTGFLNAKNSRMLLSELWGHLASAMESTSGIPTEFMEQKKEEIKKRQAEMDLIQLNARKIEEEVQRAERREHGSPGRRRGKSRSRSRSRRRQPRSTSPGKNDTAADESSRVADKNESNYVEPAIEHGLVSELAVPEEDTANTNKKYKKSSRTWAASGGHRHNPSESRSHDNRRSRSRSRERRRTRHRSSRQSPNPPSRRRRRSSSHSASRERKSLKVVVDSQDEAPRKRRHYRKKNSESSDSRSEDHRGNHDPGKPRRRSPRLSPNRDRSSPKRYRSSSPSHRRSSKQRRRSTERCNSPHRRGRSPTPPRSLRQESRRTVSKHESSGRRPVTNRGKRHSHSSEDDDPRKVESPVRFGASSPPDAWRRDPRKKHQSISPRRKQAMLEIASSGDESRLSPKLKKRRKLARQSCTSESDNSDDGKSKKNTLKEPLSPPPKKLRDRLENRKQETASSNSKETRRVTRHEKASSPTRCTMAEPSNGRVHRLPSPMNHGRLPPSPSSSSARRRGTTSCASPSPRRRNLSTCKEQKRGDRTPITERLKRMAEQPTDDLLMRSVHAPRDRRRTPSLKKKSLSPSLSPRNEPRRRVQSSTSPLYARRSESPRNLKNLRSQQSPESVRERRPSKRAPSCSSRSDDSVKKLKIEKKSKKEKKRKKHKKHKHKKAKDRQDSETEDAGSSLDELRREALCSMVPKK